MAAVQLHEGDALVISRPPSFDDIHIGSSISVNGVCLSVVAFDDDSLSFNVVRETNEKTTLGSLRENDHVNLERSLSVSGRLDGHIVQGHVEGVGMIEQMAMEENQWMLVVRVPPDLSRHVIHKGSIAIDGVSLTVASISDDLCAIALIPHTLEHTTLGSLTEGDRVNIETDVIVRYAASLRT